MSEWFGEELGARFQQAAVRGVTDAIGIVETEAVRLIMSPPKSGVVYRRRGVEHQASAPGEAPANDVGTLVNNRTVSVIPETLSGRLTFHAAHAIMLELGTRNMEPRPFARPAVMNKLREVFVAITAPMARIGGTL